MTYAHDEAIKILGYAKEEYRDGSYASAAYLANIAKSSFKLVEDPISVKDCDDLISMIDYILKGKAMVRLLKNNIVPTRNRVLKEIIRSKEFDDLEALTLSSIVA